MLDTILTTKRDTIVARYASITEQLDQPTHKARVALDKTLADTIAQAERLNAMIHSEDIDIRTICFVCSVCGAYANDRTDTGMCLCDDGCGAMPFDMIVL